MSLSSKGGRMRHTDQFGRCAADSCEHSSGQSCGGPAPNGTDGPHTQGAAAGVSGSLRSPSASTAENGAHSADRDGDTANCAAEEGCRTETVCRVSVGASVKKKKDSLAPRHSPRTVSARKADIHLETFTPAVQREARNAQKKSQRPRGSGIMSDLACGEAPSALIRPCSELDERARPCHVEQRPQRNAKKLPFGMQLNGRLVLPRTAGNVQPICVACNSLISEMDSSRISSLQFPVPWEQPSKFSVDMDPFLHTGKNQCAPNPTQDVDFQEHPCQSAPNTPFSEESLCKGGVCTGPGVFDQTETAGTDSSPQNKENDYFSTNNDAAHLGSNGQHIPKKKLGQENGICGHALPCQFSDDAFGPNQLGPEDHFGLSNVLCCSNCADLYHRNCVAKTYPSSLISDWVCDNCSVCEICRLYDLSDNPALPETVSKHERKSLLLFCETCNRASHVYCLGLASEPKTAWRCSNCVKCLSCGSTTPSSLGFHGITALKPASYTFNSLGYCEGCYVLHVSGNRCRMCCKLYPENDFSLKMVECDICHRWTHRDCDPARIDALYSEMENGSDSDVEIDYSCPSCLYAMDFPQVFQRLKLANWNEIITGSDFDLFEDDKFQSLFGFIQADLSLLSKQFNGFETRYSSFVYSSNSRHEDNPARNVYASVGQGKPEHAICDQSEGPKISYNVDNGNTDPLNERNKPNDAFCVGTGNFSTNQKCEEMEKDRVDNVRETTWNVSCGCESPNSGTDASELAQKIPAQFESRPKINAFHQEQRENDKDSILCLMCGQHTDIIFCHGRFKYSCPIVPVQDRICSSVNTRSIHLHTVCARSAGRFCLDAKQHASLGSSENNERSASKLRRRFPNKPNAMALFDNVLIERLADSMALDFSLISSSICDLCGQPNATFGVRNVLTQDGISPHYYHLHCLLNINPQSIEFLRKNSECSLMDIRIIVPPSIPLASAKQVIWRSNNVIILNRGRFPSGRDDIQAIPSLSKALPLGLEIVRIFWELRDPNNPKFTTEDNQDSQKRAKSENLDSRRLCSYKLSVGSIRKQYLFEVQSSDGRFKERGINLHTVFCRLKEQLKESYPNVAYRWAFSEREFFCTDRLHKLLGDEWENDRRVWHDRNFGDDVPAPNDDEKMMDVGLMTQYRQYLSRLGIPPNEKRCQAVIRTIKHDLGLGTVPGAVCINSADYYLGPSLIQGYGLFAGRDFVKNEMIIEYTGELIRPAVADKREREYTSNGIGCYMFALSDSQIIDATMVGNHARFINHSCDPNCSASNRSHLGSRRILIVAKRNIKRGTELSYDYKFSREKTKIPCNCGSTKCRTYLN